MIMRVKQSFTLLEILLVLTLMSLIASVVGWQIGKCVNIYAAQTDIEAFYTAIKQAQVLSLTYQTDIDIHIFKEKGSYCYRLQTDEPFIDTLFDSTQKQLKNLTKITFNGQEIKQLDLYIYASSNIEPRGVLGFFSKEETAMLWMDFQGAFAIALSHQKPKLLKEGLSPTFPKEVLKNHLTTR